MDARSDLYSLGALMYALLTGRPPLEGKNLVETMMKIRQETPARPKQFQPGIPDALEALVMKLLAKDRADRYLSATALLAGMEQTAKPHGLKL